MMLIIDHHLRKQSQSLKMLKKFLERIKEAISQLK